MGRGVAEAIDLVVAARVLLDVRVAPRQVGLGLVVVEVADEVLDGVVREELAELGVELRSQRLVVGDDERGLPVPGDDLRQGERLAGAGDAQKGLLLQPLAEPVDELVDRLGLVAGRLEVGDEFEVGPDRTIPSATLFRTGVLGPRWVSMPHVRRLGAPPDVRVWQRSPDEGVIPPP